MKPSLPYQKVELESEVKLDRHRGDRLQPDEGAVLLMRRAEAGLELVEVGGVRQVEVRPRHEHRGLGLTLSHVLHRGNIRIILTSSQAKLHLQL